MRRRFPGPGRLCAALLGAASLCLLSVRAPAASWVNGWNSDGSGCRSGFHMEQYGGDPPSEGCVPNGGGYSPPPPDPRIGASSNLNEMGRAAMRADHYEKARDFFQRAYRMYPDNVYKDNELIADAGMHFDEGLRLMKLGHWESAIAEFQRAEAVHSFSPAGSAANIRTCHYNEWIDAYNQAIARKDYDAAIMALRQASGYGNVDNLSGQIAHLTSRKLTQIAEEAYKNKDYDTARAKYDSALRYDPTNAYLLEMRTMCVARKALSIADQGADMDATAAAFEAAIEAYRHAIARNGTDKYLPNNLAWIREQARVHLYAIAKRTGHWAAFVRIERGWANEAPADAQAAKDLGYAVQDQAFALSRHGQSADAVRRSAAAYREAVALDPTDATAQKNLRIETAQLARISAAQAMARRMVVRLGYSPSRFKTAREQLSAAAATDPASTCPWSSAAGCARGATVDIGSGETQGPLRLTSPAHDTPAQHAVRTELLAKTQAVQTLSAQLSQTHDSMQHALIKAKLAQSEYDLHLTQVKAKAAGIVLVVGRRKHHAAH